MIELRIDKLLTSRMDQFHKEFDRLIIYNNGDPMVNISSFLYLLVISSLISTIIAQTSDSDNDGMNVLLYAIFVVGFVFLEFIDTDDTPSKVAETKSEPTETPPEPEA